MTDRPRSLDDAALEAALRDLAGALAVPAETSATLELDPARLARIRIQRGEGALAPRRWTWPAVRAARPLGRGLAVALVAVLAVAAVAGAIGLGLPGIRIVPPPTGSAAATPVASGPAPSGWRRPGAGGPAPRRP